MLLVQRSDSDERKQRLNIRCIWTSLNIVVFFNQRSFPYLYVAQFDWSVQFTAFGRFLCLGMLTK